MEHVNSDGLMERVDFGPLKVSSDEICVTEQQNSATASKLSTDEREKRVVVGQNEDETNNQKDARNHPVGMSALLNKTSALRYRFTSYILVTAILSTIMLLATVAFVTLLWFGTESNQLWRRIVFADWTTRAITLSALILRSAVSLQAGIATSMIAALIIESDSVRLIDAEISLARLSNSGPHYLFWVYIRQSKSAFLSLLLAALSFTTLVTQFTSTLLLSDVSIAAQLTSTSDATKTYGFSSRVAITSYRLTYLDYGAQPPRSFPVFGEYLVAPHYVESLGDTGSVLRSFLPILNQSDRESLRDYQGPAFVYDSRVACTRPILKSLYCCDGNICGEFVQQSTLADSVLTSGITSFNCSVPETLCDLANPSDPTCYEQSWTLCPLHVSAGGLISILDPTNNASLRHEWREWTWVAISEDDEWRVDVGNAYFLINATVPSILGRVWDAALSSSFGVWTDVYFKPASNDIYTPELRETDSLLRVTLCYDSLYVISSFKQDID
jgi:hypothetical protein